MRIRAEKNRMLRQRCCVDPRPREWKLATARHINCANLVNVWSLSRTYRDVVVDLITTNVIELGTAGIRLFGAFEKLAGTRSLVPPGRISCFRRIIDDAPATPLPTLRDL